VARGQSYTKILQITFSEPGYTGPVTSAEASFFDKNGLNLRSSTIPVNGVITNGKGRLTQSLRIPADLIEQAIARKSNPFFYRRVFTALTSGDADVTIWIASEAAADFSVRRLELYFPNRRGQTTVPQYTEDLKAYAEISFTGSGLLEGRWEVDRRTIKTVKQYLTFGDVVILESPKAPILPTFNTGTHVVRFVIEKPTLSFPLPAIIYFVTPLEYPVKAPLVLLKPDSGVELPLMPFELAWHRSEKAEFYLIEFIEEGRVVFSAMTRESLYLLARSIIDHYFVPGRSYEWRVKGFDRQGHMVMESEGRSLRFVGSNSVE